MNPSPKQPLASKETKKASEDFPGSLSHCNNDSKFLKMVRELFVPGNLLVYKASLTTDLFLCISVDFSSKEDVTVTLFDLITASKCVLTYDLSIDYLLLKYCVLNKVKP